MENKEDSFVVIKSLDGEGSFFYYRNGKLHRELGPAIVIASQNSEKLGDEHLYKEEIIKNDVPPNYNGIYVFENLPSNNGLAVGKLKIARYYLEGEPYSKEDFLKILPTIQLKNQLENELSTSRSNTKKMKV